MNQIAFLLAAAMMGTTGNGRADDRRPYTRNVAIVVYDGAEPLDWAGPFEVYQNAARFGAANGEPAFSVYIVARSAAAVDSQGMRVLPTWSIEDAPRPDIVLFPGGGTQHVLGDPVFFAWAERTAREAEIAQSVCTGAFVLGRAGLLDGQDATTHYSSTGRLQASFPSAHVRDGRRYVDAGRIVTTAGISAGIDGSLHVVARLLGRRIADQVATYMEYHWTPEAYLAGGYSYLNPSTDDRGRKAQSAELSFEQKQYAEAAELYRELLDGAPDDRDLWAGLAQSLGAQGRHSAAGDAWARSVKGLTGVGPAFTMFQAAREYARAGRTDDALTTLAEAFAQGYPERAAVMRDPAFEGLRSDPRLARLTAEN